MKKRVLFIGPRFYFYPKLIKENLEDVGYDVTFFEERYYGLIYLILKCIGESIFKYFSTKRYDNFLNKNKYKYDILFVIRGESLPVEFVESLKQRNPRIKTILYEWDSIKNFDYRYLIKYFDTVATFDKKDAIEYNLLYYPLFYTNDSIEIRNYNGNRDIDLLFIATYLPERIKYLRDLIHFTIQNNIRFDYYLYITKFTYLKNKIFKRNYFRGIRIHFKPLSRQELIQKYKKSKVIIDVSNIEQTGLSMRVIEMIGAGRKIISTNKEFQNNIDLSQTQFLIINSIEDISSDFISSKDKQNNYHNELLLDSWLKRLISKHEN